MQTILQPILIACFNAEIVSSVLPEYDDAINKVFLLANLGRL